MSSFSIPYSRRGREEVSSRARRGLADVAEVRQGAQDEEPVAIKGNIRGPLCVSRGITALFNDGLYEASGPYSICMLGLVSIK